MYRSTSGVVFDSKRTRYVGVTREMKAQKALLDTLTKFRVPIVCAALVLFYFGRASYSKYAERQIALENAKDSIAHVETRCAALRGGSGCSPQVDRLLAYCAEGNFRRGEEGIVKPSPGGSGEFELHYVALAIRHGDRSAIHTMPGSLPYDHSDEGSMVAAHGRGKGQRRKPGRGHPIHGNNYLDTRALQFLPQLSAFEIKPLDSTSASSLSSASGSATSVSVASSKGSSDSQSSAVEALRNSLDPTQVFQIADTRLPPGMLTTRGFMQHVLLGRGLAKAYSGLLSGVNSARNVRVRSTNYARTIQSATALLLGMLPDVWGNSGNLHQDAAPLGFVDGGDGASIAQPLERMAIEAFIDEGDEVMHGVGLKLSSHQVDSAGEKAILGSCTKAVELAKQQKAAFTIAPSVQSALEVLFDRGVSGGVTGAHNAASLTAGLSADARIEGGAASSGVIRHRFVTDLADAAVPHLCHNEELPCSSQGSGCMSEGLLGQLMEQADRAFCDRYTGRDGGKEGSKVSIFPFLHEVINGLSAQADAYITAVMASSSTANSSAGVNGGSATTITTASAPGAASVQPSELDIFEARRVKLQVYSGHDTVIAPVLAGLGAFTGTDCVWPPYASRIAFELWRPAQHQKHHGSGEWRVRVIFNGKDISALIPACKEEASQRGNKSTVKSKMCSLSALKAQVKSLIEPATTLEDACRYS